MRARFCARFCALALAAGMASAPALAGSESSWVLAYEGKSSNALAWDKRTPALLRAHLPPAMLKDMLNTLRGPPDPALVVDGRYATMSACMSHACPYKALFWIDSQRDAGIGATYDDGVLMLGSKTVSPRRLPEPARKAIVAWLAEHELAPRIVQFVTPGGVLPLAIADFTPPARFQAPRQGPSFDCGKAATPIEKTICVTPSLAAQDLQLATLVRSLRSAWGTTGSRQQMIEFQRQWLKERNAQCRDEEGMAACLEVQYRDQYERLRHWKPRPE